MIPKFRAWDKKRGGMLKVNAIRFYHPNGFEPTILVDSGISGVENTLKLDDCILMQSTGLKDKNGAEIFDGDIVKVTDYDEYKDSDCGIGQVEFLENFGFYNVSKIENSIFELMLDDCQIEVVGNIYENSELLYNNEMKKYYLRHKYLSDFDIPEWNYLNLDKGFSTLHINSGESNDNYQTQFTDDDIENLVQNHGLNLSEFDKVRVEED